eukprot:TRINITY_DN11076_c0_g1_i1.p1 TRINITY_DN11076_c0_g1~~TRINITY_DN11076_c0_g1_i1.p1  ORF type:complete len:362 (+),score=69.63 TRINITY_DN11076_c0_g1_i1:125-1210(+)
MSASDASILIFGGVGFIGRNLVQYLVENKLCKFIRVIDIRKPSTSWFGEVHKKAFENGKVEYIQGGSPGSIKKCFADVSFDYVVNLAAETRYGEDPLLYEERVLGVTKIIAEEAQNHPIKKFIELSTAQVYEPHKKPATEESKLKPWTKIGEYKLKSEEFLKTTKLPVVIIRAATVYGPGDTFGLMPRIIAGRVYKHMGKKLKCLWDADLRMNTVHVRDCCKAIWHLCLKGEPGKIYNLADKNDTDQAKVNAILESMFGIQTGYHSKLKSNLAKMHLQDAQSIANDKHLPPWTHILTKAGIEVTPLSPYIAPELLYNTSLSVDGSLIEKTGFVYDYPKLTESLLREELDYAIQLKIFPPMN